MTMTIKRLSKLSSWLARQCQARSQTQDLSLKDKLCHRVINSRIHSLSLLRGIKITWNRGAAATWRHFIRYLCRAHNSSNRSYRLAHLFIFSWWITYKHTKWTVPHNNEIHSIRLFIIIVRKRGFYCSFNRTNVYVPPSFSPIDTKKKAREEKEKYNKFRLEPKNIAILSSIAVSWMFACLLRLFVCLFGGLFSHRIFLCSLVELDQKRSSRKIHFG